MINLGTRYRLLIKITACLVIAVSLCNQLTWANYMLAPEHSESHSLIEIALILHLVRELNNVRLFRTDWNLNRKAESVLKKYPNSNIKLKNPPGVEIIEGVIYLPLTVKGKEIKLVFGNIPEELKKSLEKLKIDARDGAYPEVYIIKGASGSGLDRRGWTISPCITKTLRRFIKVFWAKKTISAAEVLWKNVSAFGARVFKGVFRNDVYVKGPGPGLPSPSHFGIRPGADLAGLTEDKELVYKLLNLKYTVLDKKDKKLKKAFRLMETNWGDKGRRYVEKFMKSSGSGVIEFRIVRAKEKKDIINTMGSSGITVYDRDTTKYVVLLEDVLYYLAPASALYVVLLDEIEHILGKGAKRYFTIEEQVMATANQIGAILTLKSKERKGLKSWAERLAKEDAEYTRFDDFIKKVFDLVFLIPEFKGRSIEDMVLSDKKHRLLLLYFNHENEDLFAVVRPRIISFVLDDYIKPNEAYKERIDAKDVLKELEKITDLAKTGRIKVLENLKILGILRALAERYGVQNWSEKLVYPVRDSQRLHLTGGCATAAFSNGVNNPQGLISEIRDIAYIRAIVDELEKYSYLKYTCQKEIIEGFLALFKEIEKIDFVKIINLELADRIVSVITEFARNELTVDKDIRKTARDLRDSLKKKFQKSGFYRNIRFAKIDTYKEIGEKDFMKNEKERERLIGEGRVLLVHPDTGKVIYASKSVTACAEYDGDFYINFETFIKKHGRAVIEGYSYIRNRDGVALSGIFDIGRDSRSKYIFGHKAYKEKTSIILDWCKETGGVPTRKISLLKQKDRLISEFIDGKVLRYLKELKNKTIKLTELHKHIEPEKALSLTILKEIFWDKITVKEDGIADMKGRFISFSELREELIGFLDPIRYAEVYGEKGELLKTYNVFFPAGGVSMGRKTIAGESTDIEGRLGSRLLEELVYFGRDNRYKKIIYNFTGKYFNEGFLLSDFGRVDAETKKIISVCAEAGEILKQYTSRLWPDAEELSKIAGKHDRIIVKGIFPSKGHVGFPYGEGYTVSGQNINDNEELIQVYEKGCDAGGRTGKMHLVKMMRALDWEIGNPRPLDTLEFKKIYNGNNRLVKTYLREVPTKDEIMVLTKGKGRLENIITENAGYINFPGGTKKTRNSWKTGWKGEKVVFWFNNCMPGIVMRLKDWERLKQGDIFNPEIMAIEKKSIYRRTSLKEILREGNTNAAEILDALRDNKGISRKLEEEYGMPDLTPNPAFLKMPFRFIQDELRSRDYDYIPKTIRDNKRVRVLAGIAERINLPYSLETFQESDLYNEFINELRSKVNAYCVVDVLKDRSFFKDSYWPQIAAGIAGGELVLEVKPGKFKRAVFNGLISKVEEYINRYKDDGNFTAYAVDTLKTLLNAGNPRIREKAEKTLVALDCGVPAERSAVRVNNLRLREKYIKEDFILFTDPETDKIIDKLKTRGSENPVNEIGKRIGKLLNIYNQILVEGLITRAEGKIHIKEGGRTRFVKGHHIPGNKESILYGKTHSGKPVIRTVSLCVNEIANLDSIINGCYKSIKALPVSDKKASLKGQAGILNSMLGKSIRVRREYIEDYSGRKIYKNNLKEYIRNFLLQSIVFREIYDENGQLIDTFREADRSYNLRPGNKVIVGISTGCDGTFEYGPDIYYTHLLRPKDMIAWLEGNNLTRSLALNEFADETTYGTESLKVYDIKDEGKILYARHVTMPSVMALASIGRGAYYIVIKGAEIKSSHFNYKDKIGKLYLKLFKGLPVGTKLVFIYRKGVLKQGDKESAVYYLTKVMTLADYDYKNPEPGSEYITMQIYDVKGKLLRTIAPPFTKERVCSVSGGSLMIKDVPMPSGRSYFKYDFRKYIVNGAKDTRLRIWMKPCALAYIVMREDEIEESITAGREDIFNLSVWIFDTVKCPAEGRRTTLGNLCEENNPTALKIEEYLKKIIEEVKSGSKDEKTKQARVKFRMEEQMILRRAKETETGIVKRLMKMKSDMIKRDIKIEKDVLEGEKGSEKEVAARAQGREKEIEKLNADWEEKIARAAVEREEALEKELEAIDIVIRGEIEGWNDEERNLWDAERYNVRNKAKKERETIRNKAKGYRKTMNHKAKTARKKLIRKMFNIKEILKIVRENRSFKEIEPKEDRTKIAVFYLRKYNYEFRREIRDFGEGVLKEILEYTKRNKIDLEDFICALVRYSTSSMTTIDYRYYSLIKKMVYGNNGIKEYMKSLLLQTSLAQAYLRFLRLKNEECGNSDLVDYMREKIIDNSVRDGRITHIPREIFIKYKIKIKGRDSYLKLVEDILKRYYAIINEIKKENIEGGGYSDIMAVALITSLGWKELRVNPVRSNPDSYRDAARSDVKSEGRTSNGVNKAGKMSKDILDMQRDLNIKDFNNVFVRNNNHKTEILAGEKLFNYVLGINSVNPLDVYNEFYETMEAMSANAGFANLYKDGTALREIEHELTRIIDDIFITSNKTERETKIAKSPMSSDLKAAIRFFIGYLKNGNGETKIRDKKIQELLQKEGVSITPIELKAVFNVIGKRSIEYDITGDGYSDEFKDYFTLREKIKSLYRDDISEKVRARIEDFMDGLPFMNVMEANRKIIEYYEYIKEGKKARVRSIVSGFLENYKDLLAILGDIVCAFLNSEIFEEKDAIRALERIKEIFEFERKTKKYRVLAMGAIDNILKHPGIEEYEVIRNECEYIRTGILGENEGRTRRDDLLDEMSIKPGCEKTKKASDDGFALLDAPDTVELNRLFRIFGISDSDKAPVNIVERISPKEEQEGEFAGDLFINLDESGEPVFEFREDQVGLPAEEQKMEIKKTIEILNQGLEILRRYKSFGTVEQALGNLKARIGEESIGKLFDDRDMLIDIMHNPRVLRIDTEIRHYNPILAAFLLHHELVHLGEPPGRKSEIIALRKSRKFYKCLRNDESCIDRYNLYKALSSPGIDKGNKFLMFVTGRDARTETEFINSSGLYPESLRKSYEIVKLEPDKQNISIKDIRYDILEIHKKLRTAGKKYEGTESEDAFILSYIEDIYAGRIPANIFLAISNEDGRDKVIGYAILEYKSTIYNAEKRDILNKPHKESGEYNLLKNDELKYISFIAVDPDRENEGIGLGLFKKLLNFNLKETKGIFCHCVDKPDTLGFYESVAKKLGLKLKLFEKEPGMKILFFTEGFKLSKNQETQIGAWDREHKSLRGGKKEPDLELRNLMEYHFVDGHLAQIVGNRKLSAGEGEKIEPIKAVSLGSGTGDFEYIFENYEFPNEVEFYTLDAGRVIPYSTKRHVRAPIEQTPYKDGSFDAAISLFSWEYADLERSGDELYRILKPGGKAIILLMHPDSSFVNLTRRFKGYLRFLILLKKYILNNITEYEMKELLGMKEKFTSRYQKRPGKALKKVMENIEEELEHIECDIVNTQNNIDLGYEEEKLFKNKDDIRGYFERKGFIIKTLEVNPPHWYGVVIEKPGGRADKQAKLMPLSEECPAPGPFLEGCEAEDIIESQV